ncbi:MAG: alpha/beta hydrolase [Gammaproteobacteria bacterium]|nr:alpha/beta hydrolase [Gammaproteobacteria bacterium]
MQTKTIILIHGLWMTGFEMAWLRRQLRIKGYKPIRFSYRMLSRSLDFNIEKLREIIDQQSGPVDLVGHSLGGVLALQTLRKYPDLKVARVVCLGSPLLDTHAGRNLARFSFGRFMLGKTLPEGVFRRALHAWRGKQLVGSIAGSKGVGLGNMVASLKQPHDGMIEAHETKLSGIGDNILLPVTHTTMLTSQKVVDQIDHFLRLGYFDHPDSTAHASAEANRQSTPDDEVSTEYS